jgi:hypothetical protein
MGGGSKLSDGDVILGDASCATGGVEIETSTDISGFMDVPNLKAEKSASVDNDKPTIEDQSQGFAYHPRGRSSGLRITGRGLALC